MLVRLLVRMRSRYSFQLGIAFNLKCVRALMSTVIATRASTAARGGSVRNAHEVDRDSLDGRRLDRVCAPIRARACFDQDSACSCSGCQASWFVTRVKCSCAYVHVACCVCAMFHGNMLAVSGRCSCAIDKRNPLNVMSSNETFQLLRGQHDVQ